MRLRLSYDGERHNDAGGRHVWRGYGENKAKGTLAQNNCASQVKGALLAQVVDWLVDKLADDHWSIPHMKAVLAQT